MFISLLPNQGGARGRAPRGGSRAGEHGPGPEPVRGAVPRSAKGGTPRARARNDANARRGNTASPACEAAASRRPTRGSGSPPKSRAPGARAHAGESAPTRASTSRARGARMGPAGHRSTGSSCGFSRAGRDVRVVRCRAAWPGIPAGKGSLEGSEARQRVRWPVEGLGRSRMANAVIRGRRRADQVAILPSAEALSRRPRRATPFRCGVSWPRDGPLSRTVGVLAPRERRSVRETGRL